MIHDNFIKKIEQESPEFISLMNILSSFQEYAIEGRKLLCLVNHILDYYILNESDDVKMPIIYFPLCEEWAQNLCEDFVALKMAILFGDEVRNINELYCKIHHNFCIPSDITRLQRDILSQQYKLRHIISKNLTSNIHSYPSTGNEKCLLYSRYISVQHERSRNMKRNYHFVHDFICTDMIDRKRSKKGIFATDKSLILLGDNEKDLYNAIEDNDGEIKIPNIFLFLQKDMDGRNTQLCMQMQRSTINEYNEDYDAGVKNVFFFAFSQKPYRLQRIFENKCNLVERLQREKIASTRDFISFTMEEMDYIFGRHEENHNYLIVKDEEDSDHHQIKMAFDIFLQDIPHEMKLRNELAICFTEHSRRKIKNEIIEINSEANEEYIGYFLELLHEKTKKELEPQLFEWINFHQIAVVLDFNLDAFYRHQLQEYLKNDCGATAIRFYTFRDFKVHKQGHEYWNSIRENKILVLSMLNHCTGRNWAIYPNSFDQFQLNPGQSVLQINNLLVFNPRYSWYKYRYMEQLKLLLNSNYRTKYIKCNISLPEKPTYLGAEPKDDEDEQTFRNRQSGREQVRYTITFSERQHRTLDEDELVLCQNYDELVIYTIADIVRVFDDPTILQIQPLTDFYQPLQLFIDSEERKTGGGEIIIRNNPKYGLSEEEKESKREMWKILLEHRVKEMGEQKVYDEIMRPLLPVERIQMTSFRRWLDTDESSILPRSRRMQKRVLEDYLEIENLYTRLLRHRKSRISTNTEGKNLIFRTFLTHCLIEPDVQKAYSELSHEVRDYLNIANGNDVKIIVDLINSEVLNLRQIKTIEL